MQQKLRPQPILVVQPLPTPCHRQRALLVPVTSLASDIHYPHGVDLHRQVLWHHPHPIPEWNPSFTSFVSSDGKASLHCIPLDIDYTSSKSCTACGAAHSMHVADGMVALGSLERVS